MNIKDLPQGSYNVVSTPTNINQLPQGSYTVLPTTATQPQGTGFWGGVGNVLGGVAKSIGNFGIGVAKGASQDIAGMGNVITQGIGKGLATSPNKTISGFGNRLQTNSQKLYNQLTPQYNGAAQNVGGNVGGAIIDTGTLLAPTDVVAGAKDVTEAVGAADKLEKVPLIGKALDYGFQKVLNAIPEAAVGFGYGKLKGQTNQQAAGTAATFGVLSGLGEVVGDTWKAFKGGLADNVQKAIGGVKGKGITEVLGKTQKAVDAFKTMSTMAEDIKVVGDDGVEKAWQPTKTTFGEALQALKQTKDTIYKAYSDVASKAGDEGVAFVKDDFQKVVDNINSEAKNGTSAFKNKAASLIKDLTDNFGVIVDNTGKVTSAADTDLMKMQDFLEKVNTDVNPASDKAAAQVSSKASQSIREQMDNKIENATGNQYQKLRDGYANMKSIEGDMVNQFKRSVSGSGSKIAGWVQGFGTLDVINSLLKGNPGEAVSGISKWGLGAVMKYLKDPENNLQEVFSQLSSKDKSALITRLSGTAKSLPVK